MDISQWIGDNNLILMIPCYLGKERIVGILEKSFPSSVTHNTEDTVLAETSVNIFPNINSFMALASVKLDLRSILIYDYSEPTEYLHRFIDYGEKLKVLHFQDFTRNLRLVKIAMKAYEKKLYRDNLNPCSDLASKKWICNWLVCGNERYPAKFIQIRKTILKYCGKQSHVIFVSRDDERRARFYMKDFPGPLMGGPIILTPETKYDGLIDHCHVISFDTDTYYAILTLKITNWHFYVRTNGDTITVDQIGHSRLTDRLESISNLREDLNLLYTQYATIEADCIKIYDRTDRSLTRQDSLSNLRWLGRGPTD